MGFLTRIKRALGGEELEKEQAPLQISEPLNPVSNAHMQELMRSEQESGPMDGARRDARDIEESGVLQRFAALEGQEVPESEYDRTIEHDAILVQQGLAGMSAEQIDQKKQAAYLENKHYEEELAAAVEKRHYGSVAHRQYGELIEELTGGVISAEEAMAMNPCGGLPGPGATELPLMARIEPIYRHAMRHDATGFLLTYFGVGPGYGTPTSMIGLNAFNPLAGQILGAAREMNIASELPEGETAAKPTRFR